MDEVREEGQPVEERQQQEEEPSKLRELFEKLEDRRESYRERGLLYRVAFTTAGFTVFLGGVAMLVLPGPALAVIPIGLAMLALQFAWAERLLEVAIDRAEAAGKSVTKASRKQKIVSGIAIALLISAAAAAAILWDIPLLPV